MKDLFGQEITEAQARKRMKARDPQPKGYAALPGTGPAGETCKSCKHIVRRHLAKTYLKCGLMRRVWSGGIATDIRAKAPACRNWEKPDG